MKNLSFFLNLVPFIWVSCIVGCQLLYQDLLQLMFLTAFHYLMYQQEKHQKKFKPSWKVFTLTLDSAFAKHPVLKQVERRIQNLITWKNHPNLLIHPFSGNIPDGHRKPFLQAIQEESTNDNKKTLKPISKQVNTWGLFSLRSNLHL